MHKNKHITWLYWLYSILSNKILPTWNSPRSSNRICLFFTLCMKACANLDKLTPATEVAEFHVKWHCSILKKKIDRIKHLCRLLGFPQWRIFCLPCFKFLAMALLPSAPRSGPCMTAVWNVKKAKSYLTLTSVIHCLTGSEQQPIPTGMLLLPTAGGLQYLLEGKVWSKAHLLTVDDALKSWGFVSLIDFSFSSNYGGLWLF